MRYTVISDIHANYPALRAVLNDAPDSDATVCLGDLIGLGGFPAAVVETVREETAWCLQGNHDLSVIEWGEGHVNSEELSRYELEHTLDALAHEQQVWVNDRPTYLERTDLGVLAAHAYPSPERSSGLEHGEDGVPPGNFVTVAASLPEWIDVVLVGHTHDQHAVDSSRFDGDHDVTVVNPGSVGQPLDSGRAEYAVVDTDTRDVTLRTAEYETEPVKAQLEQYDVPTHYWDWDK